LLSKIPHPTFSAAEVATPHFAQLTLTSDTDFQTSITVVTTNRNADAVSWMIRTEVQVEFYVLGAEQVTKLSVCARGPIRFLETIITKRTRCGHYPSNSRT
jgi:hypothetical protein